MNKKYLNLQKYINFAVKKLFGRAHTTYSQCGEDLILEYLQHHKEKGFYVDVGANDPRVFSNTYFFYKKGWEGIVIEPNLKKINQYKFFRNRDTREHCAVGEKGAFTFYKFKEDPLNTMLEEVAHSYEKMGHKIISTEKVNCVPLSEIFREKNIQHIDFMSVDTEGQNLEVLKTNDWNIYRPAFIVLETVDFDKPQDKTSEEKYNLYMEEIGYIKVANTPINTIYRNIK